MVYDCQDLDFMNSWAFVGAHWGPTVGCRLGRGSGPKRGLWRSLHLDNLKIKLPFRSNDLFDIMASVKPFELSGEVAIAPAPGRACLVSSV